MQSQLAKSDNSPEMIWLFERGQEALRLEMRFDTVHGDYVLVVVWADNRVETHRFREAVEFDARLRALEPQLAADHWTQVGPPTILSEGWKGG
jgi:hypothetical protein